MKKRKYIGAILISLSLIFGYISGILQKETLNDDEKKLIEVLKIVKENYMDTINSSELVDNTIQKLLHELDPHSVYISPVNNELEEMKLRGNFIGIGVEFVMLFDTAIITKVIENGPSYKAGLKVGDRLISTDNKTLITNKSDNIVKLLLGNKGTSLKIKILRENNYLTKTIERDEIEINSLSAYFMYDNIAYLKLETFAEKSYNEMINALNTLEKTNQINSIILDLRNNGGGYLDIAVKICEEFLNKGDKILTIKDTKGTNEEFISSRNGKYNKTKLAIILNKESASASEVVAGAIQDNDRGIIIGKRSFGKGLVQKPINLNDKSVIRLTTQRYYTPSGRSIQKDYSHGVEDYYMETYTRIDDKKVEENIQYDTSKVYYTRNHRKVYGGGGISPDSSINDIDNIKNYFNYIIYMVHYNKFINSNLKIINKYNLIEKFKINKNYKLNEELILNDFINFFGNNNQNITANDIKINSNIIFEIVNNEIKKLCLSKNDYIETLIKNDKTIQISADLLKNKYNKILRK